jgi:hypothetical protein
MSDWFTMEEELLRLRSVREDLRVTVKSVAENSLGEALRQFKTFV